MSMSENDEQAQLPVLIIGAEPSSHPGICGLALAHGLHNNNIPYKVLEKDPSLSSPPRGAKVARDWAIACHWAVPTLASLLGPRKWSRNHEADIDPTAAAAAATAGDRRSDPIKVINGRTGAVENEIPSSADFRRFVRSRLRALIAGEEDDAGVRGEGGEEEEEEEEDVRLRVRYGKKLVRVSYGEGGAGPAATVTAHFADGTAETGRLLVGADGSQSVVRQLVVVPGAGAGAELKRLPFGATFVNATFARERALWLRSFHPVINVVLHPGDMVGMLGVLDASDPGRPESWRFSFYISWRLSPEELEREDAERSLERGGGGGDDDGENEDGDEDEDEEWAIRRRRERRAEWLRAAKEKSRLFAEPLRSCYDWLDDDHEEVYYSRVANWDPSLPEHRWDNHGGLVTLAGDAAHPMTYHRGQGLNHALADAGKLVELLAKAEHDHCSSQEDLVRAYEAEMRARAGEEVRQSETNTAMLHDWSRVQQSPLLRRGMQFGSGGGGGGSEGGEGGKEREKRDP
ncbi:hypothetical protein F5X99DRAFT_416705 [Biscogniauxia marginata]|nr:hypothetical protein F5X99DRAFT_416705 [Biscogniauxia marginata]